MERGERREGTFVRRREQGETFVRQRKKEWRSAAWESGEAGRIAVRGRAGTYLGGSKSSEGIVDEVAPEVGILGVDNFVLDFRDGLEKELAEVSEDGGVASGETVLGDGGEELAEDVVDINGGEVFAGGGSGDLPAQLIGLDELALGASMENAESGMILVPEHAALAAVGKREKT
jgi:hypothetical protein